VRLNVMALAVAASLFLLPSARVATAGQSIGLCELPKDLESVIAINYPGRTLVRLSDLGDDDRALYRKDHRDGCPGLVKVDFYGDGKPTLALALTTKGVTEGKTELVLARQIGTVWKTITLDKTDGPIPAIWSEKPGQYEDVYGEKKIHASSPVIVFCGYSSWAILYAWTGGRVTKIWLRD
jgi:hypothetical protein